MLTRIRNQPAAPCRIVQGDNRPFHLSVETIGVGLLRCRLDEANQKRLRAAPALAQLGLNSAGNWTPQSNPVLVTNLQDIVTGRDVRRERQIREARESPQRFMDVLTVLCSGDDEERLKQFLTYCDIPVNDNNISPSATTIIPRVASRVMLPRRRLSGWV